jgi:hypothetical protein
MVAVIAYLEEVVGQVIPEVLVDSRKCGVVPIL